MSSYLKTRFAIVGVIWIVCIAVTLPYGSAALIPLIGIPCIAIFALFS